MQRSSVLKVWQLLQLIVIFFEFSSAKIEYENEECENPYPGVCTTPNNCPGLEATMSRLNRKVKDVGHCGFKVYDELICCPNDALMLQIQIVTSAPDAAIRPKRSTHVSTGHLAREACKKFDLPAAPQSGHGGAARPGDYPYMAALIKTAPKGHSIAYCSGTLIEKRFVLTTAHCLEKQPEKVIFGVTDFTSKLQLRAMKAYNIKKTTVHSNYTAGAQGSHDIGIIELTEDVQFSVEIYPACLHTDMADLSDHTLANFIGFGDYSLRFKTLPKQLLTSVVEIVALDRCNRLMENSGIIASADSYKLCALDLGIQSAISNCDGSAGGAIAIRLDNKPTVVGVITGGYGCGSSIPTFSTRVAKYIDFIESVVWAQA